MKIVITQPEELQKTKPEFEQIVVSDKTEIIVTHSEVKARVSNELDNADLKAILGEFKAPVGVMSQRTHLFHLSRLPKQQERPKDQKAISAIASTILNSRKKVDRAKIKKARKQNNRNRGR